MDKKTPRSSRKLPKLKLRSHRVVGFGLSGAGLFLLLAEAPVIAVLGGIGFCVGSTYALATFVLSGALKNGIQVIDDWELMLNEREKTINSRAEELRRDKETAKQLLEKVRAKMHSAQQMAGKLEADLQTRYERRLAQTAQALQQESKAQLKEALANYQSRTSEAEQYYKNEATQAIAEADARALQRIKLHKSRLLEDNQQLHEEIERLKELLEQREEFFLRECNDRIGSYKDGFSQLQLAIDEQSRSIGEAYAAFQAQYDALTAERDRYRQELQRLSAPRRFQFKGVEYEAANEIQQILNSRGIVLACHSIGKNLYGVVPLYFEAISCDSDDQIRPHLKTIQLNLGLPETPRVSIQDGGLIEIEVNLSRETVPEKAIAIVDPPLTKLESALQESIHVRIAANSGSGKSVLLGNLVNYLCSVFVPDYHLSDPKVTAPEVWGNLKPRYYSFECLDHLFGLIGDVMRRVEKAKEAVKNDNPIPAFNPQFHVFDEMEMLYGLSEVVDVKEFTPKAFKNNVKMMLKAGREHQLKLLFVTQSPLPSDLNLRKNDFFNTSSILLGKCISDALYDESSEALLSDLSREKKAQLKAEYRARLIRKDKYFFLFYNPNKPLEAWFGKCPPPGYYANLAAPGTAKPATPTFGGGTLQHFKPVENVVTDTGKGVQVSTAISTAVADPKQSTEASTAPNLALIERLEEGTYCPNCKHHTTSYRKIRPNGKGNISVTCRNLKCETKTFTWNVLQLPEVENG